MAEPLDIVIAGNGPVGMLLALALESSGVESVLVGGEREPAERPIALSYNSRILLERVGAFRALAATPIQSIHVSQRGGFGRTLMRASECGLEAFGYVVSYSDLCASLRKSLATPALAGEVRRYAPSRQGDSMELEVASDGAQRVLQARLLVLAEGGPLAQRGSSAGRFAWTGRRDYGQSAVVALVRTERAHGNGAWERFTPEGPIALLPFGDRLALIWSTTHESAHALCALNDAAFLARLSGAFGARLGRFVEAGARSEFALALRYRRSSPEPRVLAIGNAAQTLHPVAGQGLNLGLRDAWDLARLAEGSERAAIGSGAFVRRYVAARALDRGAGIGITDALVRVFSNDNRVLSGLRGAGLAALDLAPPARRFFARRMMFGARALP